MKVTRKVKQGFNKAHKRLTRIKDPFVFLCRYCELCDALVNNHLDYWQFDTKPYAEGSYND